MTTCLWPRPAPASEPSEPSEPLSARYRYSGGRSERRALDRAVEAATAELNPLVRGIARSRITSAVEPRDTLEFAFGPNRVTLRSPGMPLLRAPLDRPIEWMNPEGSLVEVRCRLEGDTLRIRYRGDGGDTRITYRFDESRSRLEMRARIDHVRLPATLEYGLTYRRD